jgi:hypothetical protein
MVGLMRCPFGVRHLEDPRLLRLYQLYGVPPGPPLLVTPPPPARWITIAPPREPSPRGPLDHDRAAGWITSRAPMN